MSVVCGWIGVQSGEEEASAAGAAMARAAARDALQPAGARTETLGTSSSTFVCATGIVPVSQCREGETLIAVIGQVRWESPELEELARDSGAARAAARAYAAHGFDCVKSMHGPFALAVADGARRRGMLAIDRMAIRTLSYAPASGGLVFGTRADCVAAHPAVGERISLQGIYNYLYCENVPAPGSIYEGVGKLLPGQRVTIDDGRIATDFYWRLDYTPARDQSEAAQRSEFRQLLHESVARTAGGDGVGTFLSGGTDSSTVTGMLTELRAQPVDTYSIGFDAEGFDEMGYARIAARHFASRAHEYYVTPRDVADAVSLIAAACDEPFGNASAVPTYFCARLARDDGRSILLAGDGGDELFGGNARYAKQKVFEWYGLVPSGIRRGLIEPVLASGRWVERITPLRKARSYVQQAAIPLPDRLETYNFLEREVLEEIFEPDFLRAIDPHQTRAIARDVYARTNSPAAVNRMMHLDLKETLADNDLRKVNRMCDIAGIEVRFPLLDDDLVAFSGRLSAAQKVRGLRLRAFFKDALSDFLPPETIRKSKHGFGLPFGVWMERDPALREIAHEALTSFRRRGYVRPAYVDRVLDQHETGHASYYGVMIWIVMMLERWMGERGI
jgi:asparagine synthase (glutamine-hydrolysing)